jgi:hypothetical protein
MMKLLKNKWARAHRRHAESSLKVKPSHRLSATSAMPRTLRSINSSSPVLEDNLLTGPLETNSEENGNHIFEAGFNQMTLSDNESQAVEDDDQATSRTKSI